MFGDDRNSRLFSVLISECLTELRKNLKEHNEIYGESMANYRQEAIAELKKQLVEVEAGRKIKCVLGLTVPVSYKDNYESAIGLLESLEIAGDTRVDVTAKEHAQFVRNRWGWVQTFNDANSRYTVGNKLL